MNNSLFRSHVKSTFHAQFVLNEEIQIFWLKRTRFVKIVKIAGIPSITQKYAQTYYRMDIEAQLKHFGMDVLALLITAWTDVGDFLLPHEYCITAWIL